MNLAIELYNQPMGQLVNALILPVTPEQAKLIEKLVGTSTKIALVRLEQDRTPEGRRSGSPPGFLSGSVLSREARAGKDRRARHARHRSK